MFRVYSFQHAGTHQQKFSASRFNHFLLQVYHTYEHTLFLIRVPAQGRFLCSMSAFLAKFGVPLNMLQLLILLVGKLTYLEPKLFLLDMFCNFSS
jgi:hypothetical protein